MDFLEERGVDFDPDWTVPMLWDLVKLELEGDSPCFVDDVASKAGVKIMRLPPYHPEVSLKPLNMNDVHFCLQLNPIELVWAFIKAQVSKRNCSFKVSLVKDMVKESIATMPPEVWKRCVRHSIKQEIMYAQVAAFYFKLNPLIFTVLLN